MKVVISTRGSEGDVNPFLALSKELKKRGHDVVLFMPSKIKSCDDTLGLDIVYQASEDIKKLMNSLNSDTKSTDDSIKWLKEGLDEQFKVLPDLTKDADVLISAFTEFSAPSIAEFRKIPLYRVGFIPAIPGDNTPPLLPIVKASVFANRGLWNVVNGFVSVQFKSVINSYRENFGLGAISSLSTHNVSFNNILAMSKHFHTEDPAWERKNIKHDITGYFFGDEIEIIPSEVLNFINAGEKPIYMGFGSAVIDKPKQVGEIAAKVFERLNVRAILSSGWTNFGDGLESKNIYVSKTHLPHQTLFPMLKGAITHAGSGTTHTVAKSGIPHLALPRIVDQYHWGNCVEKAGTGPNMLPLSKMEEKKFYERVSKLVNESVYEKNSKIMADKINSEEGVKGFVNILEERIKK